MTYRIKSSITTDLFLYSISLEGGCLWLGADNGEAILSAPIELLEGLLLPVPCIVECTLVSKEANVVTGIGYSALDLVRVIKIRPRLDRQTCNPMEVIFAAIACVLNPTGDISLPTRIRFASEEARIRCRARCLERFGGCNLLLNVGCGNTYIADPFRNSAGMPLDNWN